MEPDKPDPRQTPRIPSATGWLQADKRSVYSSFTSLPLILLISRDYIYSIIQHSIYVYKYRYNNHTYITYYNVLISIGSFPVRVIWVKPSNPAPLLASRTTPHTRGVVRYDTFAQVVSGYYLCYTAATAYKRIEEYGFY